jgi:transposase
VAQLLRNDAQWHAIEPLLPRCKSGGRPSRDRRVLLDGILWILRTGAPWQDVPEEFGPWQHHKKNSFIDEYSKLLMDAGIEFEDKYL